jgi:S-adenosylmethionine hydrolase
MIVLFTDFGLEGSYTGQVEAVLYRQAPGVPVINLFSDLTPFDIQSAAYLLPAYVSFFPPGTVFICVVDPGVGGDRPGVVLKADSRWFVGPDDGLFTLLVRRADKVEWWRLPEPENVASSFHGRDVFAPAAARLARDGKVSEESGPAEPMAGSVNDYPGWPDDLARVVYIDHYGNAVTGVRVSEVSSAVLTVNGHMLRNAATFSSVPEGAAFWYGNSNGLIELAVNQGRADKVLGLSVGSEVRVE